MRSFLAFLTVVCLVCVPGLLECQQNVTLGTGVGVEGASRSGTPGFQIAPAVQAMVSLGILDYVRIGTVVEFTPASGQAQSGLEFRSVQLEPRITPFSGSRVQPFIGGRIGYARHEVHLPVEGRRIGAGGFVLGAIGGAALRASANVSFEFGTTVTSLWLPTDDPDDAGGRGLGFGLYLGTSVTIGR